LLSLLSGVVALLAVATPAGAISRPKPTTSGAGGGAGVIAELQAAKQLLMRANHDYQGHRARAVGHVTAAIHALAGGQGAHKQQSHMGQHKGGQAKKGQQKPGQALKAHKAGQAKKPMGGGGMTEPQAVSDAQLRQAIQQLATVQRQLTGHHAKAQSHVGNAIQELHVALQIR
jgi:hypothetical protein